MTSLLKYTLLISLIGAMIFSSCIEFKESFEQLPPGPWRGTLYLDETTNFRPGMDQVDIDLGEMVEKIADNELPFNFTVRYNSEGEMEMVFTNANEEIIVRDIEMGTDNSIAKDTIRARFPGSENYLKAIFAENVLQGFWVVPYRSNYQIPFEAKFGKDHRFEKNVNSGKGAEFDYQGKWEVTFDPDTDNPRKAIAEIQQEGQKITGTFLTNTGDYRFLEGTIEEDKIWLSTFDGVHAFLFGAKRTTENILEGFFKSGSHYSTNWIAEKNDEVQLSDPLDMTKVLTDKFTFTAIDLEGNEVTSDQYEGYPTLILITGSWCPNCRDAVHLLIDLKNEYDIEIVGLAFERYRDSEKAIPVLKKYQNDLDLNFPILYAGYFDKEEATQILGLVNEVISYPTVIFLNSDQTVSGVYTGFSGPATSAYPELVSTFNTEIKKIIEPAQ